MVETTVENALALVRAHYVFPEKAAEAAAAVRSRLAAGRYADLDEAALGAALTEDLYAVCADRHLRVRPRGPGREKATTEEEFQAAWREEMRRKNHGVARVERLAGNVGLLDLRSVTEAGIGGRTIAAAMQLVAHTDALLVDLRRNGGGAPDGVAFWNSWFFPDGDTHLNSIYDGTTGETRQYWTLDWLPGERYLDRPVWILISGSTFSAGEEFAYNLQARGRATLVGETTRGGAHPTQPFPLTDLLEITVPLARSINPVTGTNWEGVGVRPDVPVAAEQAFPVAYRAALDHVATRASAPAVVAEARAALTTLVDAPE